MKFEKLDQIKHFKDLNIAKSNTMYTKSFIKQRGVI